MPERPGTCAVQHAAPQLRKMLSQLNAMQSKPLRPLRCGPPWFPATPPRRSGDAATMVDAGGREQVLERLIDITDWLSASIDGALSVFL